MFKIIKAKDFKFLNPPDKNNELLNRNIDHIAKEGSCDSCCSLSCPFESERHNGCFALHTEECKDKSWKERVEIYKKMFYNFFVQEEFEV